METPKGLPYAVSADVPFAGIKTTDFPALKGEITRADPLFIEMVRRVRDTGLPEHFAATWAVGDVQIKNAPSVMYRSDNPTEPNEREGK